MVTVFDPTSTGIDAVHCVVPEAVPEAPMLVDQVTFVTPTLSDAMPLKTIDAALVETLVPPGAVIVRAGAVMSPPGGGGGGFGGGLEGGGGGAAAVPSCAAYIVRIAALSPAASVVDIR